MSSPFLGYPIFFRSDAPFGLLYSFEAGSSIPKSTFTDKDNIVPNTNPVLLDATGSAIVRLGEGSYKFVLLDQSNTVTLFTADNYDSTLLTAASVGAVLYPRSVPEIAASVVPIDLGFIWGDPRRFGAVLDGITDDTAALLQWALVSGEHTFPGGYTALISSTIFPASNSTYEFSKGGVITTAVHDKHLFQINAKQKVVIRGAHFLQTSIGLGGSVGGIGINDSNDCVIEECEFEGMQYAGIWAQAVTRCVFRGNYIHDPLGTIADSCDIYLASGPTTTSSYNLIDGNFCYGTTFEFGIACWDPYSGVLPLHNIISNNRIGAHNGYGILIYMPDVGDTYTQVIGNQIQDISAHSTNTDSGAGIYVVGAGAGGTVVMGNTVRNCCITTTTLSLAPAGIGVSTTSANTVPITVQGNVIEGMTKYWGILATGIAGGASINGNTVRMPAANITGDAIRVTNSANVTVSANVVTQLNTTTTVRGIMVFAQSANCIEIVVANNTVTGGHQSNIETVQSGGFIVSGLVISGNMCNGGDNTCIPLLFNNVSVADALVTGNYFSGGSATVVSQTGCTNVRYSNNRLKGTGTAILTTSGVCTGSSYSSSNFGTGAGAGVVNAATGFIVEQFGTAAPGAGTWAVGDMVRNSVPSAAGVLFWVTTTAGAGTWKTVSNT